MMGEFQIIVQKYGGTTVSEPRKIRMVAEFIRSKLSMNRRICVVVSAMGHTTNELISLAHKVATDPSKRELDMLISCGERSSMALLAMALNDIGVKALSLTGSQSGIITDDQHNGAQIIAIKPNRVKEAFFSHDVVIVAGFQGVSEKGEITTLRRGGSDTTAIALAYGLFAESCEIYTDVPGVMDADPKIVLKAHAISELSFDQMEKMALYGAKVMAHDAIMLAKEKKIELRVMKMKDTSSGTHIREVPIQNDGLYPVVAITHLRALLKITMRNDDKEKAAGLGSNYFLCGASRGDIFEAYVSNDISQELVSLDFASVTSGLALITVHLKKNQAVLMVLSSIKRSLLEHGVLVRDFIVSSNEIFVVVPDDKLVPALSMLHASLPLKRCSQ